MAIDHGPQDRVFLGRDDQYREDAVNSKKCEVGLPFGR
jgi:hypothetical protein